MDNYVGRKVGRGEGRREGVIVMSKGSKVDRHQSRGQFRFCNSIPIPIPVISIPINSDSGTTSLRQFNSNSNSDDGNSTPIPVNSLIHRQRLYHVSVIILAYFFLN